MPSEGQYASKHLSGLAKGMAKRKSKQNVHFDERYSEALGDTMDGTWTQQQGDNGSSVDIGSCSNQARRRVRQFWSRWSCIRLRCSEIAGARNFPMNYSTSCLVLPRRLFRLPNGQRTDVRGRPLLHSPLRCLS